MDRILAKLQSFGMIFCDTGQLCATFQKLVNGAANMGPPVKGNPATETAPATRKLVTAKDIQKAVDGDRGPIMLAPGGIMTPLARDLAKEYGLEIIKT